MNARDTSLDDYECGDCDGECTCCPGSPDGDHVASEGGTECDYCCAPVEASDV
jgi:hypothetical protein